jgi:hypothetical protein
VVISSFGWARFQTVRVCRADSPRVPGGQSACSPRTVRYSGSLLDRFLAVSVVARDVEELAGRTRHAAPETMDERGAGRAILERRDGVVVGRTGEFGAALGEALNVLTRALSGCCLLLRSSHCLPRHV